MNIVRRVWHDMSGKTHQNGQELAIKREVVRKGSRKEKDSKVGVKTSGKQDIGGGGGVDWVFLLLFFSGFMALHFSFQNWLVPIYKLEISSVALGPLIHHEPQKGVGFVIQTKILF